MNSVPGSTMTAAGVVSTAYGKIFGWTKITKTYADFSIAATEKQLTIYTLPVAAILLATKVKCSVAFAGGGAAVVDLRLGITGSYNYERGFFFSGCSLMEAVAGDTFWYSTVSKACSHTATTAFIATLNSDVNIDTLAAGSVDVWLLLMTAT